MLTMPALVEIRRAAAERTQPLFCPGSVVERLAESLHLARDLLRRHSTAELRHDGSEDELGILQPAVLLRELARRARLHRLQRGELKYQF